MHGSRRAGIAVLGALAVSCSPESGAPNVSIESAAPIATSSAPDHSLGTFVEPTTGDHFGQPVGIGTLRICRSAENTVRDAVPIRAGTIFSDTGVIDQPPEQGGGWWLLWVETTQSVSLAAGQDCTTAEARVVPSEVPANYSDMRPLTRFSVADRRFFEIMSDGENLDRYPALLLMNATAQTDFH